MHDLSLEQSSFTMHSGYEQDAAPLITRHKPLKRQGEGMQGSTGSKCFGASWHSTNGLPIILEGQLQMGL